MKYKNFEEFLGEYHCKENPTILDDDLPDAFDDWLAELGGNNIEKLVELGDEYAKSILANPLDIRFKGKRIDNGEEITGDLIHTPTGVHMVECGQFTVKSSEEVTPESVEAGEQ